MIQAHLPTPGTVSDLPNPSFIEVQFPVSKLSKESYKERTAVAGQTLTALGKWWGRKPLVLVRALILGLLLPATDHPEKDREVFLKLMTMDDEGLWRRVKSIPPAAVYERLTPREREGRFYLVNNRPRWARGLEARFGRGEKEHLQRRAFFRMGYDEKLSYCVRPEETDGPSPEAWAEINAHLETHAASLPELVQELGQRRFGHIPRVGDVFCGGGSIPFEAARLGCEAFGSDLSPVAALLTWGALNIVGGGPEVVTRVRQAQERVYAAVQRQVDEWDIERNEAGEVADAYLYCNEVLDPATGWRVPLAPSWVIATKTNVIARLVPNYPDRSFSIEIAEQVPDQEMEQAVAEGTWNNGVKCPVDRQGQWLTPERRQVTSVEQLRGRDGLRLWENEDLVPRPDDVFQERLYCIRWVNPNTGERRYAAPAEADLSRETRVLKLLRERFADWQAQGYIPSRRIESGNETDRLFRERGWTYWHHLFNARQLLLHGLISNLSDIERAFLGPALLLIVGRIANWNSRLCRWQTGQGGGIGGGKETFYNQALNTLANYSCRATPTLSSAFNLSLRRHSCSAAYQVELLDARTVGRTTDVWITDPGYADAINYEELSEFFLAWYEKRLPRLFPGWYTDSKRALAVKGTGESFRTAMVECYRNITMHMPESGFQIVMFTHQDAAVWADLAMVLWAAGLRVTAAWTIATETGTAGIRQGNYVQGTVCLALRKRAADRQGEMADLFPDIQAEVARQIDTMTALDDEDDPNFGDADYQLAAYAAALRILTSYSSIAGIDLERELRRPSGEASPLTPLIQRAVRIASDYLVPRELERSVWRRLTPEERLYLKGIEVESAGDYREGVYHEFARSYGAGDYRELLASTEANRVRLKTPSEFAGRGLDGQGFAGSLLRRLLYAVYSVATHPERDPRPARQYLHQEVAGYWDARQTIIALLRFLADKPQPQSGMAHWATDVTAARLLLGSVENDSL